MALFAGSLVLRSEPVYSPLWDGWVGCLAVLAPTVACLIRAVVGGRRRAGAAWLGIGMLSFFVGNVIYLGWTQFQTNAPVPSPADVAYLGIDLFAAIAVVCLVRREVGSLPRSLWLDGALGAAGGATALAAVLSPVFAGIQGDLGEVLVGVAYPVADLVLVAMVCGLLAVRGLRGGSMWLWLMSGLTLFCAADVVYALRLASDTYVVGTILDGLWAFALTVMAVGIWRPERPRQVESERSAAILVVPMLATLTAAGVLVVSAYGQLPTLVIALAAVTLVLAIVRTFVSFREVQRLSDARRQAITDELTGLGNRRRLYEHGARRLQNADRGERFAFMLLDLDNFKQINDTLGHQAGDELLREIARRLAARVSHPDLLVRLGGDEFALLVTLAAGDDGYRLAQRILDRLTRPLVIEGTQLQVAASAGVAERENTSVSIADLLRRADVAMFAAKVNRSRIERYDAGLDEANRSRLETLQHLDDALAEDQFVLHYQPKIDIQSGAIVGAEALVRWQHPTRGLLYPDAFLPILEQSGRMGALTQIVLNTAVRQLATWRAAGLTISVAVNLSASDLLDEHLAERLAALLAQHAVPTSALELEITESVLMTDPQRARSVLQQLQRLGLRIALDDYGTGYSALAYLRDLPVDELKIDRSFIANISADRRSAAIVRSTIELAHALGLQVVAEGVEQQHDLDALAAFDCDFAQGYHFSRPLPADAFATWAGLNPWAASSVSD